MLLGHRSKSSPLFRIAVRREFTMAHILCQVANVTIHQRPGWRYVMARGLVIGGLDESGSPTDPAPIALDKLSEIR